MKYLVFIAMLATIVPVRAQTGSDATPSLDDLQRQLDQAKTAAAKSATRRAAATHAKRAAAAKVARQAAAQRQAEKATNDPVAKQAAARALEADLATDNMVRIPSGSFTMGSTAAETQAAGLLDQAAAWERPQHLVTIQSFALAKYDVTFDDWDACVSDGGCGGYRSDDAGWGRGKRPVIDVSWTDAQAYITWLSAKRGHLYRLPTEAEWEYAARAGTTTAYYWGDAVGSNNANCNGCGSAWDVKQTSPVASFAANPWSLYDMAGNVWQWTSDCWNENYAGAPTDGSSWASGTCNQRIVRGGSFRRDPLYERSANRDRDLASGRGVGEIGFRLARTLP